MTRKIQTGKSRFIFWISALVIIFFASCERPAIKLGNSFIDNSNTNIIVVDTISADISTVFVDSFPTTGTGNMFIGRYKDPYFGTITSGSYLQVGPPLNIPSFSNLAGYDSMVLILRTNKRFYGDTTKLQRYQVSQLQSVILLPGTQPTFFNNSKFPYNPVPLGSTDAIINPLGNFTSQKFGDSLKIKMPDNTGLQLFNMLVSRSDTVKNSSTFIGFFKGLYLYPDENSLGAIYGFSDSIIMRMYYHEPGVVLTNKTVDFLVNNGTSNQFNHVDFDRTGTPLQNINQANNEIPSTATGNAGYIQSGSGLEIKVRFPYLWKLAQLPDYVSVLRAQLIVRPVLGTYTPELSLPPSIILSQTNQNNLLGSALTISGVTETGNLSVDYLYGANTTYTYDVSGYIKQQIAVGAENNAKNGLMLVLPSPDNSSSFNRAVIGDKTNPANYRIELKLYYVSFF